MEYNTYVLLIVQVLSHSLYFSSRLLVFISRQCYVYNFKPTEVSLVPLSFSHTYHT